MRNLFPKFLICVIVVSCYLLPSDVTAQKNDQDEEFKNLKILPKDISKDDLDRVMDSFTRALGVRCDYCHVNVKVAGQSHPKWDFPADDKDTKKTARIMLKMVNVINSDYIKPEKEPVVKVECITCHRGQNLPRMIEDILEETINKDGLEAAVKQYRNLREKYYGGFTFDFSDRPLNHLGATLANQKKYDEALTIYNLNLEFNPKSGRTHLEIGSMYEDQGELETALKEYETAAGMMPDMRRLNEKINDLKSKIGKEKQ